MSDRTNRVFTTEFKKRAVMRLEAGEQFSALDAELGVRRKLLYAWRKAWQLLGIEGLNRKRGPTPGGSRPVVGETDRDPLGFGPRSQLWRAVHTCHRNSCHRNSHGWDLQLGRFGVVGRVVSSQSNSSRLL